MIKFAAKYLKILDQFRSNGDIRYYLDHIRVEPHPENGVLLIATNGHIMCVIHDAEGVCSSPIILRVTKQMVAAGAQKFGKFGKSGSYVLLNPTPDGMKSDEDVNTSGHCMILSAAKSELFILPGDPIVDAKYPDWRKVIPTGPLEYGLRSLVNSSYLTRIAKVLCSKEHSGLIFMHQPGEKMLDSALIVKAQEWPEVLAVVMPMRVDESELVAKLPDWMPKKAEPEQTKAAA